MFKIINNLSLNDHRRFMNHLLKNVSKKCITATAFKGNNTKLSIKTWIKGQARGKGAFFFFFFTLQFFNVIFSLTLLRPTALRLLHVANAHSQRDYNTYLSEAELHGYYVWGRLRSLPVGNTLQCA